MDGAVNQSAVETGGERHLRFVTKPDCSLDVAVVTLSATGDDTFANTIDELQAKATTITGQRDTLFKGETLRGLLLSAYAWSTVGRIAGIAAWVAFAAGAVMIVLVVLGIVHERRITKANEQAVGATA